MSRIGVSLIKFGNRIFKPVRHPFNLADSGEMSYAEWQYEKGMDTVACYAPKYKTYDMFENKTVLDMGCGAAGKSLYYVSQGASRVVGVDIVQRYEREAEELAKKLGYEKKFSFVCASAFDLPFPDQSFDTIIMNDFMEHVSQPADALKEAYRLLRSGGRIFVNFPPYLHPYGAHLTDAINTPWCQVLWSEKSLIAAYHDLVRGLPDEKERISLRFSYDENGREYMSYINKMTLVKFRKVLKEAGLTPEYYAEIPLRKFLTPLAKIPGVKEMFVRMGVCVIRREG